MVLAASSVATAAVAAPGSTRVVQAVVQGSGPWTAWFGGAPKRTVVVRVRNTNPTTATAARVVLRVREGGHASRPLAQREVGTVAPGQLATYRLDVTLPRFPATRFHIEGEVQGSATPTHFAVGTAVVPWGLVAIVAVLVQLGLLRLRNRLRARLFSRRRLRAEALETVADAFRPLLLLNAFDPLQYWVTTWNPVTRRRWRRAVLIEQTAIAASRGDGPRQLPRGA